MNIYEQDIDQQGIILEIDKVVEAKAKAKLRLVAVFGLIPPPPPPTTTHHINST